MSTTSAELKTATTTHFMTGTTTEEGLMGEVSRNVTIAVGDLGGHLHAAWLDLAEIHGKQTTLWVSFDVSLVMEARLMAATDRAQAACEMLRNGLLDTGAQDNIVLRGEFKAVGESADPRFVGSVMYPGGA